MNQQQNQPPNHQPQQPNRSRSRFLKKIRSSPQVDQNNQNIQNNQNNLWSRSKDILAEAGARELIGQVSKTGYKKERTIHHKTAESTKKRLNKRTKSFLKGKIPFKTYAIDQRNDGISASEVKSHLEDGVRHLHNQNKLHPDDYYLLDFKDNFE